MSGESTTPEARPAASRASRFWDKPLPLKLQAIRYHFKVNVWNPFCGRVPLPVRLPWGGWWLAGDDVFSDAVFAGITQEPQCQFIARLLKPGMTAMDIGAYHGFYSLLMSKLVGPDGRVVAFEPSPRAFRKLTLHLKMNRTTNVLANHAAVADFSGTSEFYMVRGYWTAASSLHRPAARQIVTVSVRVRALDDYLQEARIPAPDFIKLDAEGAEPQVFRGAMKTLTAPSRPIFLCEVDDGVISAGGWEHSGESVLQSLEAKGFQWFSLSSDGGLQPASRGGSYRGDYVAVPAEKLADVQSWVRP